MEEGPHIECVDRIAVHRRQYLLFVGPGQREALTAFNKNCILCQRNIFRKWFASYFLFIREHLIIV